MIIAARSIMMIHWVIFSLRNTCVVLTFMADKQKSDMANAKSIARLRKILGRYPTICILYWAFLIIFLTISKVLICNFMVVKKITIKNL